MASTPEWYRLDNAAIIFPILSNKRYTTFFRISATLKEPVNYLALEGAVKSCIRRFPYFFGRLRRGFFWHFFEREEDVLPIYLDTQSPCMPLPKYRGKKQPLRIRVYKKRIALEITHFLTDGTGAVTFLKTLLLAYFQELGLSGDTTGILSPHEEPDPEEWEDSFLKHYQKKLPAPPRFSRAFKIPYPLLPKGQYRITTGEVPLDKVKSVSKSKGLSITEYLMAHYIYAFQQLFFKTKGKRPIRMMVPVNLRNLYESKSLKNFFLTVPITVDPRLGHYSLEEIQKKVHHYLRVEVDQKFINQQITRNVRGVILPVTKLMPLFIKTTFIGMIARSESRNFTSSLSNLGPVKLPEWMEERIENFLFFPPPSPHDKTNCSILSYKERIYISMGRSIAQNPIERVFFQSLIKEGIPVKIAVNQKER